MKREFTPAMQPDIIPAARSSCEAVGAGELNNLIGFVQEQNGREQKAAGVAILREPFGEAGSQRVLDQSTQGNEDEDVDRYFKSTAGVGG